MKTITVELAGKKYIVESLKFKAERTWRKTYDAPINTLISAISSMKNVSGKDYDKPGDFLKDIGGVILAQAGELVQGLLNSPDTLLNAICDYSPALAAERDFIEENCYQDEIARAFVEVLKIAYPFGQLLGIVTSLGSQEKQTTPNSPLPSGESGKTT